MRIGKAKRDMEADAWTRWRTRQLQSEIHRHRVVHVDRLAAIRRRAEMPLADCFARRFAESVRQILDDLDVVDRAVAAHDAAYDDRPLNSGAARHHRIARNDAVDFLRLRAAGGHSGVDAGAIDLIGRLT